MDHAGLVLRPSEASDSGTMFIRTFFASPPKRTNPWRENEVRVSRCVRDLVESILSQPSHCMPGQPFYILGMVSCHPPALAHNHVACKLSLGAQDHNVQIASQMPCLVAHGKRCCAYAPKPSSVSLFPGGIVPWLFEAHCEMLPRLNRGQKIATTVRSGISFSFSFVAVVGFRCKHLVFQCLAFLNFHPNPVCLKAFYFWCARKAFASKPGGWGTGALAKKILAPLTECSRSSKKISPRPRRAAASNAMEAT